MKDPHKSLMARLHKKLQSHEKSRVFARLADGLRISDHIEEAIDLCEQYLEFHPDYASGHVVLGKCYLDLGNLEEAREAFLGALAIDSENILVYKSLGDITFRQGDLEAAAEHYRRVLELDPRNAQVKEVLEKLQTQHGHQSPEDSPIELPTVTEVPVFKDQLSEPAESMPSLAKDEPSADSQGEESKLSPEETELLREEGDEEAGKGPPRGMATATLAEVYFQQGLLNRAIETYQKVLRHQPDDEAIKDRLAELKAMRSSHLKKKKASGEKAPQAPETSDKQKAEEPDPAPHNETTGEL